jgi:hypothetical protein
MTNDKWKMENALLLKFKDPRPKPQDPSPKVFQ